MPISKPAETKIIILHRCYVYFRAVDIVNYSLNCEKKYSRLQMVAVWLKGQMEFDSMLEIFEYLYSPTCQSMTDGTFHLQQYYNHVL